MCSSTEFTQQSKYRGLYWKNGSILKPKNEHEKRESNLASGACFLVFREVSRPVYGHLGVFCFRKYA